MSHLYVHPQPTIYISTNEYTSIRVYSALGGGFFFSSFRFVRLLSASTVTHTLSTSPLGGPGLPAVVVRAGLAFWYLVPSLPSTPMAPLLGNPPVPSLAPGIPVGALSTPSTGSSLVGFSLHPQTHACNSQQMHPVFKIYVVDSL